MIMRMVMVVTWSMVVTGVGVIALRSGFALHMEGITMVVVGQYIVHQYQSIQTQEKGPRYACELIHLREKYQDSARFSIRVQ